MRRNRREQAARGEISARARSTHGLTLDELERALARAGAGRGARLRWRRGAHAIARDDRSSRLLTAAVARAWRARDRAAGAARTAGIFVGAPEVSPESVASRRQRGARGLPRLSASAFTRMVLNASTARAPRSCRQGRPHAHHGRGSGLAAVVYAAHWLRRGTTRSWSRPASTSSRRRARRGSRRGRGVPGARTAAPPAARGADRGRGDRRAGPRGEAISRRSPRRGSTPARCAASGPAECWTSARRGPVFACRGARRILRGGRGQRLVADPGRSVSCAVVLSPLPPGAIKDGS